MNLRFGLQAKFLVGMAVVLVGVLALIGLAMSTMRSEVCTCVLRAATTSNANGTLIGRPNAGMSPEPSCTMRPCGSNTMT